LILLIGPWYENITSSVKPEVHKTYRNAVREGPSHGHTTELTTYTKIWRSSAVRADRQTNRKTDKQTNKKQADILIQYNKWNKWSLSHSQCW